MYAFFSHIQVELPEAGLFSAHSLTLVVTSSPFHAMLCSVRWLCRHWMRLTLTMSTTLKARTFKYGAVREEATSSRDMQIHRPAAAAAAPQGDGAAGSVLQQQQQQQHGRDAAQLYAEHLTCDICCELMMKSAALDCSHVFCSACIQEWFKKVPKPQCPTCRQLHRGKVTPVRALDQCIEVYIETNFDESLKAERAMAVAKRLKSEPARGMAS
jgi:hypothetical protein